MRRTDNSGIAGANHNESAAWLERGLQNLKTILAELVYDDGAFTALADIPQVLLHDLAVHQTMRIAETTIPLG